jgi:LacI family transcriptional regulator
LANLRDVARLAGVHVSTVSKVLRDDPSQKARPVTRERILAAAKELDYRPNSIARSLRTRRTRTLALLVPDLDNLGFTQVSHGALTRAEEAGYLVVLVDAHDPVSHGSVYERLVAEGRVDGLLVAFASVEDRLVEHLTEHKLPIVLVNRRTKSTAGSVVVDDAAGSRLAVDHLARLGHTYIGHVTGDLNTDTGLRRLEGFHAAMASHNLPVEDRWIRRGLYTEESGYEATREIVKRSGIALPTSIFVANLMSALGALRALHEMGLVVPADISIITMDDHLIGAHTNPPLTTVATPLFEMGSEAVRMLIDAIEGHPVSHVVVDEVPRVIERSSTTSPRADSAVTWKGSA